MTTLMTQVTTGGSTSSSGTPALAGPSVVDLGAEAAVDTALVGAKAAALARANAAGLPVLPGFVLTTTGAAAWGPALRPDVHAALHSAWGELAEAGARALVVRSSSTVEDGESTSMAGMFTSVLDVRGWDAFLEAVETVLSSRKAVPGIEAAPMAVLVQPLLAARVGGVLFGADPVTGRTDRIVVAAAEGAPEQLVSGTVDGAQYLLTRRGRLLGAERPVPGLGRGEYRALARLARLVAAVFGGPQDVEWAIDDGGALRLLQSRPITAVAPAAQPSGPLLGPGPVAETFPDPLSPLEEDLWVEPLRTALAEAVLLTGSASRRQVGASPVVATVGGRVAADLGFLGVAPRRKGFLARFDPRPPARRLVASWRVGRLGAALPGLVADLLDEIDEQLLAVPDLDDLDDGQLAGVLERSRRALVALNGYEVLSGLLVRSTDGTAVAGASLALHVLARGRAEGRSDDDIAASEPVVLALVAPRIGPAAALPPTPALDHLADPDAHPDGDGGDGDDFALLREALRLRVRWVQELSARAAWELGGRLAARGVVEDAGTVRDLRLAEVGVALAGSLPADLADRRGRSEVPPLPTAFRLTTTGEVVAVRIGDTGGRGAGGGRGTGRVHGGAGTPEAGAVLVVRTLDPGLAASLPHLGGLVAETGSVLSHLAILAREFGIPTVVGVPDAVRRFPAGATVVVDGSTGDVTLVEAAPISAAAPDAGVIDLRALEAPRTEGAVA